jgi:hypothetical protein
MVCPQRNRDLSVLEAFSEVKEKLNVPFSMEIIILASQSIWIVRNNKIFDNQWPKVSNCKAIYLQELKMVKHRIRKRNIFNSLMIG